MSDEFTNRQFGPRYPPGEHVFITKIGWAIVAFVWWNEDSGWNYKVKTKKDEHEVLEWQILI